MSACIDEARPIRTAHPSAHHINDQPLDDNLAVRVSTGKAVLRRAVVHAASLQATARPGGDPLHLC
jgi:hypothetical protein